MLNSLKMFITRAKTSIKTKRIFESQLIYSSKRPIFVRGYLEFIWALVSRPVNTTKPIIQPAAKTVFAHAVLSKLKASLFPSPLKEPKNS